MQTFQNTHAHTYIFIEKVKILRKRFNIVLLTYLFS